MWLSRQTIEPIGPESLPECTCVCTCFLFTYFQQQVKCDGLDHHGKNSDFEFHPDSDCQTSLRLKPFRYYCLFDVRRPGILGPSSMASSRAERQWTEDKLVHKRARRTPGAVVKKGLHIHEGETNESY